MIRGISMKHVIMILKRDHPFSKYESAKSVRTRSCQCERSHIKCFSSSTTSKLFLNQLNQNFR